MLGWSTGWVWPAAVSELIMNAFTGRQPGREREEKGRGAELSICETLRTLRIRNATTNPTRRVIYKLIAKLRAAHRTRNTHSNALQLDTANVAYTY